MKPSINSVIYEQARGGGVNLKHPAWAEYDAWADLRRENEIHLKPWEPEWDPKHLSRPSYRARLARFKKLVSNETGYPFHIFHAGSGEFMGACNVMEIRRHVAQSAQIGYWVGERYAHQGFARASVRAVSRFCFDTLGLHRVEAAVQPDNERSIKLLKAVGFQKEGRARDYLKINGTWQDHDVYAYLSSDR